MSQNAYGPLQGLIGTWAGHRGLDISPEADGSTEENEYYERIVYTGVGDTDNADVQVNMIVRYHQQVFRSRDDKLIHDQVGYWLWDPDNDTLVMTLSIPRAVSLQASGSYQQENGITQLNVSAAEDSEWGILQAPFMQQNAKTIKYTMSMQIEDNQLSYQQITSLEIYGGPFEHRDSSVLRRAQ